ncbi:MAG: hypothetical protein V2J24_11885 [Pseudomonadales bacterium]|jgi:hypothetical protein|nr:hypothetical protein [Pseudomonadales bacterium]
MNAFRIYLVMVVLVIGAYTAVVVANHGLGLLQVFFADMAKMAWPGQFNLDFMAFLSFSALWLAWRHHFSPAGLALGVAGFLLGAPFLAVYLLLTLQRTGEDVAALLLGPERAAAIRAS